MDGEKMEPTLRFPITAIGENLAAFDGSADRLVFLVDLTRGDFRQYTAPAFSEILISFDIDDISQVSEKELKFHAAVLENFIRSYRHVSQDVSILVPDKLSQDIPIKMVASVPYSDIEFPMTERERLLRPRTLKLGLKQMSVEEFIKYLPKQNPSVDSNTRAIEERLQASMPFDASHEALLRAFEELSINRNPTWALLDIFMVVEIEVAQFVERSKIAKGISRSKLNDYRRDIGISYMLNVDLPLLLSPISDRERNVLAHADAVRRKRNQVVHAGAVVSAEEALHAINTANDLFGLLKGKSGSLVSPEAHKPNTMS